MKRWGIGILFALFGAQSGCGSETTPWADPGEQSDAALDYSFQTRLVGLDETVTYVKSAMQLYVVRESGQLQSLAELNEAERQARWDRFGRLSPAFARQVQESPRDRLLWITVHFAPEVDWAALTPALSSLKPSERLAARLELRQAISSRAAELTGELSSVGVEGVFTRG